MTMMMTDSQFGLEDMEAMLWAPSSLMADAVCSPVFNLDAEEPQKRGGALPQGDVSPASPLTSSSLSSSPPPFYSPCSSPPAVLLYGDKARMEPDLLSLPWLDHPGQLTCSQVSGDGKEDPLQDLDWMAERIDLSELDLDSLIGSCSVGDEHQSPSEDLLASLDCPMELDSLPLSPLSSVPRAPSPPAACSTASVITVDEPDSCSVGQEVPSSPLSIPEPQEELEIKSEPASPEPASPSSPAFTLDLGSEVDISESEVKPLLVPEATRIVLSLSPTRIVLVLAPRNDHSIATTTEVIHCSPPTSPSPNSSRSRPYPEPNQRPGRPSLTTTKVKSLQTKGETERTTVKVPKDKKQKKMEQNKTAATRYRQKKRVEQDALITEHTLLERRNLELIEKAESMTREIQYLKELMEEVRTACVKKGLSADP
ncbi:activating transcription factor 4b [Parambassis ranga]|uniref:Cyclic AMP-dependent transcription factor ATF-4 n=1 Tax=Parambassis ranga TaxID=210632 RepID=A0A6P7IW04_9TELE|nr:cyclic AMP-dependent transcription factor ATF-4-like [Parambassis ranga]